MFQMSGDVPINVGNNPPILLIALALVFADLAIFTTPEFLIELGPGRRDLALADPLARQTASLEVVAFRGLCFIAAGVSIAASAFKGEAEDSAHLSRIHPSHRGTSARMGTRSSSMLVYAPIFGQSDVLSETYRLNRLRSLSLS